MRCVGIVRGCCVWEDEVTEMVSRVAKAIRGKVPFGYGMTDEEAINYARAAIEAMSNPTSRMIKASEGAIYKYRPEGKWYSMREKHKLRYQAMIQEALGGDKGWHELVAAPSCEKEELDDQAR